MKFAAILAVILLAGCHAIPKTRVMASSPRSITIRAHKLSDAQDLAEKHCNAEKLHARLAAPYNGSPYVFDCVN